MQFRKAVHTCEGFFGSLTAIIYISTLPRKNKRAKKKDFLFTKKNVKYNKGVKRNVCYIIYI